MPRSRPNVVVIIMDDLDWGDLACHGNPRTQTPHLDQLHGQSTRLTRYRSGTLCTPARASLMTGRYHLRTGAIDTYCGRSMLHHDEVTLAQCLRDAGYRTGIFGKWHLGDNYPVRAIDKGFEEALVHNGGGLRQPSNHGKSDAYFNPSLMHNGKLVDTEGYCTDIFTDAAMRFVEQHRDEPFFVYLATNAPHAPAEVGDEWAQRYLDMGLDDKIARLHGMIDNIDDNVGRMLGKLDELQLANDTIVMYTSDHGAQVNVAGNDRYRAGQRGGKSQMYEGGVRVPSFWRWPDRFPAGRDVHANAHVIDVMPTLLDACGASLPGDRIIDGRSLLPLLKGEVADHDDDRLIFMQWHRGDAPVRYRNYAVIGPRYKLLRNEREDNADELYDIDNDPAEQHDVAAEHPDIVDRYRAAYDAWFDEMNEHSFAAPRIHIGSSHENPVVLTRQDWRVDGPDGWSDEHRGHFDVHFTHDGAYDVAIRLPPAPEVGEAHLTIDDGHWTCSIEKGETKCRFNGLQLPRGDARLEGWINCGNNRLAARFIDVSAKAQS